jgi:hypothetical protein
MTAESHSANRGSIPRGSIFAAGKNRGESGSALIYWRTPDGPMIVLSAEAAFQGERAGVAGKA